MEKGIWLVVLVGAVALNAVNTNLSFAAGATLPWFLVGLILSPIWWLIAKSWRKKPWKWFDWLNVAAYIMILLFVARTAIHSSMQSLLSESSINNRRSLPVDQVQKSDAPREMKENSTTDYRKQSFPAVEDVPPAPQPSPPPVRRIEDETRFGVEFGDGRSAIIEGDINSLRKDMRRGLQNEKLGY